MSETRVALVTGGGQGIGRAICLKLASQGMDISVVDVNLDAANDVLKEVESLGQKACALKADVSVKADTDKMVTDTVEALGGVHVLVNNAGITRDGLIMRMKEDDWDLVMKINLKGAFNCIQSVTKSMTKQRYGRIVNIASIVGLMGNAGQANYAASKGGLIALTKTVGRELASRNVTCNAVAPGFIDTAMTQAMPEKAREALTSQIPLKRLGSSEDVANAVGFLSGDESGYITGHVISVNGGMYM